MTLTRPCPAAGPASRPRRRWAAGTSPGSRSTGPRSCPYRNTASPRSARRRWTARAGTRLAGRPARVVLCTRVYSGGSLGRRLRGALPRAAGAERPLAQGYTMAFNAEGGDFELSLNYQTYSQEDQVLITGTDADGANFTLHDTTCCGCTGVELLHVPAGTNTWRYHACVILGIPRDISPRIATICLGPTETPPCICRQGPRAC